MPSSTGMLTQQVKGRVYNYSHCLGGSSGDRGFFAPVDFAVGNEGRIYVVNTGFEFYPQYVGITACNLDSEIFWSDRGYTFGGNRESAMPKSIEVDEDENVYVSDEFNNQIYILNRDGEYVGSWGSKEVDAGASVDATGRPLHLYLRKYMGGNTGDGQLNGPSGLAFDPDGHLLVVDGHNHRVQKFTKDGQYISQFGSFGSEEGEFNMPWGITVDSEGNIFVADWRNNRVQKLSPEGRHLATIGGPGSEGELSFPAGVAVDKDGDIYVADWGNNLLRVYEADGSFITNFVGDAWEVSQWAAGRISADPLIQKKRRLVDLTPTWRFWRPVAVNVDNEGRVMALEALHHRLQVYHKEQNWLEPDFIDGAVGAPFN